MQTAPSDVAVRCTSHRAREKLLRLIGDDNAICYFRWADRNSRGIYRIPLAMLKAAREIKGVTRLRETSDIMRCLVFH